MQHDNREIIEVHPSGTIIRWTDKHGTFYIARPLRSVLRRNVCVTDRLSSARDWLNVTEVSA